MLPVNKVLLEEPDEHLSCPVCFDDPLREAMVFQCGHSVCSNCNLLLKKCPLCREKITSRFPNYMVRQIVDGLRCRCDFYFDESHCYDAIPRTTEQRCPDIFTLADRSTHVHNCPYAFEYCNRCRNFVTRAEFENHRKTCVRPSPLNIQINKGVNLNIYIKSNSKQQILTYQLTCPPATPFTRVWETLLVINPKFSRAKFVYNNIVIQNPSQTLSDLGMRVDQETCLLAVWNLGEEEIVSIRQPVQRQ